MTQAEKMNELAELFEVDVSTLTPETALDTLRWDSMSMLSLIALTKTKFDKKLPTAVIRGFKSVQDVINVME